MYKRWEFRKNIVNESPLRYKFLAKIRNFDSFGGVFPDFCPDKREIWHGEWTTGPLRSPFQISRLLGQRVPYFGPLSKNNTGMLALRAGLPVKIEQLF